MEKENIIRPSLLSADFSFLNDEIEDMIRHNIKSIHFDVMDGSFVSQISFGQPIFKSIYNRFKNRINFDVHLMTLNPIKQVKQFIDIGSRDITFHYEVFDNYQDYISLKNEYPDLKLGLAFSPDTEVEKILPSLPLFDNVLVMSVVPGKGGQPYIEGSERKVRKLNEYRKERNLNFKIIVDGGINEKTGPLCLQNGADYLVCGSYYFKAADKDKAIDDIYSNFVKVQHGNY